jgi:RNA polymerase sigma-70 factor (ECF subfamily)
VVRVEELTAAGAPAGRRTAVAADGFEALFATEFPRVARAIHHIVGDRARADEVTQDAFLELLRNWPKVAGYDRPDLWVRRVAIRKAQRERHRAWRRTELERSTAAVTAADGSAEPPTPAPEVLAAVRLLPPKQRAVVVLFYFEDRPMAEIAEILGCSESTGWSQLHTARRHLARALTEEVPDDVG